MKQKLATLLLFAFFAGTVVAQKTKKFRFEPGPKKPELFGFNFSLSDFNAPNNFGTNSNATTLPVSKLAPGISLFYTKGLTSFVDFSARLNGVFQNYSSFRGISKTKTEIGIEFVPTVNIRPVKDQNMWAPYITTGLGLGLYSNKLGAFLPIGGGLQFNSGNDFYLFVEAQYRASLTPKILPRNLYYSLGFAQKVEFEPRAPKAPNPTLPTKAVVSPTADTDGDGIADNLDACPTVKGLAAFKGCPDTDGDGIADSEDKCPTEKGIAKLNGCPIPDSDKDGINDDDDACPTAAGVARYKGCPVPDTDKDGINDEEDKCPKEFGVAANAGCPEIAQEAIQKINKAAAEIYFANGSAKLLAKSNASLNDVATFLKSNPSYKVNIAGHTDNTGKPEKNKTLSEDRANAVKAYLISQGVAADKITAEGFGDQKPIADNNTTLGKSINRRVELKVSNY